MNTKELIERLKQCDPRGECTVRIETIGLVGGIGNSYAKLPSVEMIWRGIDWSSGEVILRPSLKLKLNKKK